MKIKEFSIIHYGPLPNTGRMHLQDFNLFFGKNEYGKTLTIDALLRLLLGRTFKAKYFNRIDRVEETPMGYVILENIEGKQIKLPEKGDLEKVTGLSPTQCRNIFIIRDSDLSIAQEEEFYAEVTDKLTGLRTKEISRITQTLRKIGKITPSGIFMDTKEERLKTRIGNAKELIRKIDVLLKRAKQERFDELEGEWARLGEKKATISEKLEALEDARKRERYETGERTLNKLKESLGKINTLEIYNQADEQSWRDCKRDIQRYNKEKEELLAQLKDKTAELKDVEAQFIEKERAFSAFSERKKSIDDEIRPELKNYEIKRAQCAGKQKRGRLFYATGLISAILLVLSLFGAFFVTSLFFRILSVLFLILAIFSWIFVFQVIKERAWLAESFERINLALSRFELSADSIEGILSNIQSFCEDYSQEAEELKRMGRKVDGLKDEIEKIRQMELKLEKGLKDAGDKIVGIRKGSTDESLCNYSEKLELKGELGVSLREQRRVLESLFGSEGKTLEENIQYWYRQISDLELYKEKAKGIKYEDRKNSKLKENKDSYNKRIEEIDEKIFNFKKELEDIAREANKILCFGMDSDNFLCKTTEDLIGVKNRLLVFIREKEADKDTVLKDIKIFAEIEMEEKQRIFELFGKESPVCQYFKRITGGLYEDVCFNQRSGKIEVARMDGEILGAEKLSGGAYDQLYLSIRVALGEKLLRGQKGFFIMDDPFIKADQDRLQIQFQMLREIAESGWQIIYFSAKDEVRAALEKDIVKCPVNFVEVKDIFH